MHNDDLCRLIFIPLISLIVTYICGGFKHPITVLGAVIAVVVMTLVVSNGSSGWSYVWERVLATVIGVLAAILVNWIIHPKKAHLFHDLKRSIDNQKDKKK